MQGGEKELGRTRERESGRERKNDLGRWGKYWLKRVNEFRQMGQRRENMVKEERGRERMEEREDERKT